MPEEHEEVPEEFDEVPVISGYEVPLPVDHEYERLKRFMKNRGKRGALRPETRAKISETMREYWASRRKLGVPKREPVVPVNAELVEDEENPDVVYHEWIDEETGETRRRKKRKKETRPRVKKRRLPSAELARGDKDEEELCRLEERVMMGEKKRAIMQSYRDYLGLAPNVKVTRQEYRSWTKFWECGGIPADGLCPECGVDVGYARRKAWRALPRLRLVVCRQCAKDLAEIPVTGRRLDLAIARLKRIAAMMSNEQE